MMMSYMDDDKHLVKAMSKNISHFLFVSPQMLHQYYILREAVYQQFTNWTMAKTKKK